MSDEIPTCCEDCFEDAYLKRYLNEKGVPGDCDFCDCESDKTLPAADLREIFEPIAKLFEEPQSGVHFSSEFGPPDDQPTMVQGIEWNRGWVTFNADFDEETKERLLDSILDDPYARPKDYQRSSGDWWALVSESILSRNVDDEWEEFVDYIRHKRRFIHSADEGIPFDPSKWLPAIIENSSLAIETTDVFYRARPGTVVSNFEEIPWPTEEMTAPPPQKATRGRANPAGIPYFYVTGDPVTAVAEIRPYVGQRVSVRQAKPLRQLRIADLTKPHEIKSPYGVRDLEEAMWVTEAMAKLGLELSKPVAPDASEIDYVPIQYIAEVIRNEGYDGIRYQSAITANGVNTVFFVPEDLELSENGDIMIVQSMDIKLGKAKG